MQNTQKTLAIMAIAIGAITGLIAGLIGSGVLTGIATGAITAGVVSQIYPKAPRNFNSPRVNIAALPTSGLLAGVISSALANTGWLGGFFCSGVGWTLGAILPSALIAVFIKR